MSHSVCNAVLVAGLFPNLARIRRTGKGRAMQGLEVCVHLGSVNRSEGDAVVVKSRRPPSECKSFTRGRMEPDVGVGWLPTEIQHEAAFGSTLGKKWRPLPRRHLLIMQSLRRQMQNTTLRA